MLGYTTVFNNEQHVPFVAHEPFAAPWQTTRLAGYMIQQSPTGDKPVTQTSLMSPR